MLFHNLKLAWRNLQKHRLFSGINVLGLSIGLASCILIGMFVFNELSFDKFHSYHKNIYRIDKFTNEKGKEAQADGLTPGLLAPSLKKNIPEIEATCRFRPWFNDMLVVHGDKKIKLKDVAFADPALLTIFSFPLVAGDIRTALDQPSSAVITETTAKKYFGDTNPIGQTLIALNNMPVKVTGVAKDLPGNSSIQFSMVISWSTLTAGSNADNFSWMNNWTAQVCFTFIQTKNYIDKISTGNKISALLHRYFPEKEFSYRNFLQPLDEIHLKSSNIRFADAFRSGNSTIVYTLFAIAIFILIIACFNFINLTTAGALARAKSTGVQKVLGARQYQLIRSFFTESFLLCTLAMAVAFIWVSMAFPLFNKIAGTELTLSFLQTPVALVSLAVLLIIISVMAGLYPALFLSRFKSTDVFRNIVKAGKDNWMRKSLVTTQFALSILIIIATIVVNRQLRFMSSKDLGFNKEQILTVPISGTSLESKLPTFIERLKENPNIISISATNNIPGQGFNGFGVIPEGFKAEDHLLANELETDANFASTYKIQMVEGRFFSSQIPTDTADAIVINEAMAKSLNWQSSVGKKFEVYEAAKGRVVGVVKDFNFASLRETVQPLVILLRNTPQFLSLKIKAGSSQSALAYLEKIWKEFEQQNPLEYVFLDEQLNKYYRSDKNLLNALTLFAILAIFVACMGLLGLSIYSARQRTKEIGIRKVLGASAAGIVRLLSWDFLKPVFIASLVAFPIAWWAMNKWLQDFAYRIQIGWMVFIIAGLMVALIAFAIVSFQAIRVAIGKPVNALRTE